MKRHLDWFDEWELWYARVVSSTGRAVVLIIVMAASFTAGTIMGLDGGMGLILALFMGAFTIPLGMLVFLIAFAVFLPIMPLVFAIIATILTICARVLRKPVASSPPGKPPVAGP